MASTYLQKFPVPEQFPEILHDLLREILREQPEDIIAFAYRYFKDKQEGSKDPTRAQARNYYGRQIEIQREEDKSEIIPPPKYMGAKADPYQPDKQTQEEIDAQRRKSSARPVSEKQQLSEDHRPVNDDSKSHHTEVSNKTNKQAATEYYTDLTDKLMGMYEDSNDGSRSRPATSGGDDKKSSQSKKSGQHSNHIKEEDEVLERSRRSRED